jgi:hypothetical protein
MGARGFLDKYVGFAQNKLSVLPGITWRADRVDTSALVVGGGTAVSAILSTTATWDIASTASGAQDATVIAFTGITRNDACIAAVSSIDDFWPCVAKTDTDQVQVRCTNNSGGLLDPASGTVTVFCFRR